LNVEGILFNYFDGAGVDDFGGQIWPRAARLIKVIGDINMDQKKILGLVLSLTLLLSACQSGRKAANPDVIDPLELQAFADTFFAKQMETLHIPGVSFIFVQGGEVVYASGYGYANLETATSINPDSSVVRIGSISKPFVATAVMQLVPEFRQQFLERFVQ
jgi:hypothetical protein